MELREYWTIIRRRWWLPLGVALVAFIAASAIGLRGAAAWRTDIRVAVSTIPSVNPAQATGFDPVYFSNLSSEYLADDMSEFIMSAAFAGEVKREMATARGIDVPVDYIVNATRAKKTHRFIDVAVTTPTLEEGQELAGSISRILNDQARLAGYLSALASYNTQMRVITPPDTRRSNTPLGLISEVGLRTVVGLLAGLGLAFLVHYLDQSVRTRREAEDLLRLPVLATIPRTRRRAAA